MTRNKEWQGTSIIDELCINKHYHVVLLIFRLYILCLKFEVNKFSVGVSIFMLVHRIYNDLDKI